MRIRSEELGFGLMKGDSAGNAGDYHHNDTTIPVPMISVPPFLDLNVNEASQYYSKEMEPARDNYMIGSSQFRSAQNFQIDHHYAYEGQECKPLQCIPDSDFSYPEGYTVQPYQYTRYDNHKICDDVMNVSFHLNSFEKPHSGGKCVIPSDSSAGRPQMINCSGTEMFPNVGQPNVTMPDNVMNAAFNLNQPHSGGKCVIPNNSLAGRPQMIDRSGTGMGMFCNASQPNLTTPDKVVNATFNVNQPHSGGKCVIPSDCLAGRPQMNNRSGLGMYCNVGQPNLTAPGSGLGMYCNVGQPNLTTPDNVMNASFNLNRFEKPYSGGKCVTPSDSSVGRLQMASRSGMGMSHNVGQPDLNKNFGTKVFNPNHGGTEPSLSSGKFDEQFMTIGPGTCKDSESNTIMPRINTAGNSERIFLPPSNTYHNQSASRSFVNPNLDMNSVVSSFQNNGQVIPDLSQTGNCDALIDSRPALHLGAPYAFQRPGSEVQNHYLSQGLDRLIALPPLPHVGNQTFHCDRGQNTVIGQLVPHTIGMAAAQCPSALLPENNVKLSSQSFASPPFVVADGSTSRQDSSNSRPPVGNYGQTQKVCSIQQSYSPLGPHSTSDLGIQIGKGNMAAQVSRPSIMASLKRAASQPPPATVRGQRRRTLPAHSFIHPSVPTCTRGPPSVPNTPQAIPSLVHAAQSLTPRPAHSFVPPVFPSSLTTSALSAPKIAQSQTIPPLMGRAPSQPPHDKRISSLHPSSHTQPILPSQKSVAQSLAHQRLREKILSSLHSIAPIHIKYKEETPEPIGHKCFLCKRDLSFTPEGPISQPPVPPAVAVLSCGHTFHEHCLERITPDDQSKDPPCIPCALGE